MDKIKCIDCIFSSIDSEFCICRRSYKVRDADRLHYCRNFYEKMVEKSLKALLKF